MNIQQDVKDYYGRTLQSSRDLKTDACCTLEDTPAHLRALQKDIHPEVAERYYGCGLVAPLALDGARVLDLGSGAGRDAYLLSRLVGEKGSVVGVDFTPEQLAVARAHQDWHRDRYAYPRSNVEFIEGDIENLAALGLDGASFDIIISNCVINLCEDKSSVFKAAYDLLKPGGEFYFSDVYADRRLPDGFRSDPVARGECLGGALYWNDFLGLAKAAGFTDPRLVADRELSINNDELKSRLSPARFFSATYRLFRIDGLEPACEDYGQAVIYNGGLAYADNTFTLDNHHVIEKGRIFPVCGNTYRMLAESRFGSYFEFIGDWSTHYGIFPGCGTNAPFGQTDKAAATSGACC
ncbi:MAG: methyltransferase domain-containing protein [Parvularculaceae bacterium]|nr:methyltransferase domain-containing protein [Parvularculaceae bacterium]